MKTKLIPTLLLALVTTFASAFAHGPGQTHAGPNGGRLLTELEPHAEFFVTKERKIQITFLDEKDQPVAAAAQVVTVTTGTRAAPVTLKFTRIGDVLVSTEPLPAGNNLPAVVQIRLTPDARPITSRLTLNLDVCGDCKLAEYACTCTH